MVDKHYQDAITRLRDCLEEANTFDDVDANCCYLATSGVDRQPSVRVITIYEINEGGLLFLSKKTSGKIIQLTQNPKAGVCFYWPSIKMQATVEGIVEELDEPASEALWVKRDHNAKLTAWATDIAVQDESTESLESYKQVARGKFQDSRLPLAESWSGYGLRPHRIEFWQTDWRKNKKHECYVKKGARIQLASAIGGLTPNNT